MMLEAYQLFGLEDVRLRLGTRPAESIGSDEVWREAEEGLGVGCDAFPA